VKTGIWLYAPEIVTSAIKTPIQIIQEPEILEVKTPMTCHVVHQAQRAYNAKPSKQNLELIFQSMSRLSAQSSIQQHENLGLRKAIKIEQKKR